MGEVVLFVKVVDFLQVRIGLVNRSLEEGESITGVLIEDVFVGIKVEAILFV